MAIIPHYMFRQRFIMSVPEAIARGLTVEGFIRELKSVGLSYRRTLMLLDWRSAQGLEAKKDRAKYTRKDRTPSISVIADVEWSLSKEYMYKVKVWTQKTEGAPLEERFVTVMSDDLLKRQEIEREVFARWGEWQYEPGILQRAELHDVRHRIKPLPGLED